MRLATPAFKNRKAAILWMLILASSLIAVDYYLGEAIISPHWQLKKQQQADFEKIKSSNHSKLFASTKQCNLITAAKEYYFLINDKSELLINQKPELNDIKVDSILCSKSDVYLLTESKYNAVLYQLTIKPGRLWVKNKIISRLKQIKKFYLIDNTLYMVQKNKDRLLAISNIVSRSRE
ncbi:MAG: hypothetical protein HQL46_02645 [Gammaproteobacteria bacterium]|nr:hypothetical protein [Gammaproteobacteria bacterium]